MLGRKINKKWNGVFIIPWYQLNYKRDADVRPTKLYIDIDATYLRQVAR